MTWFMAVQSSVKVTLELFGRSYYQFSVAHNEFASIIAQVDRRFLPRSELEVSFADYLTFTEPCTMEKP